jgi:hypothetical protein
MPVCAAVALQKAACAPGLMRLDHKGVPDSYRTRNHQRQYEPWSA